MFGNFFVKNLDFLKIKKSQNSLFRMLENVQNSKKAILQQNHTSKLLFALKNGLFL